MKGAYRINSVGSKYISKILFASGLRWRVYLKTHRNASREEILASHFHTNIQLKPQSIAAMVGCIAVPQDTALSGVCPILAIVFGTDNVDQLFLGISDLSPSEKKQLFTSIRDTVASEAYPLGATVWQFNDPLADLRIVETALGLQDCASEQAYALADLEDSLRIIDDTFPFISVGHGDMSPADILIFSETYTEDSDRLEYSERANPRSRGPEAVIVPSLAVGSLMVFGSRLVK